MADADAFLAAISEEPFEIKIPKGRESVVAAVDEAIEVDEPIDYDENEDDREEDTPDDDARDPTFEPPKKRPKTEPLVALFKKAQKSAIVTATADRTKISDNTVTHFVAAMAHGMGLDVNKAVYGRSTQRSVRIQNRKTMDDQISEEFCADIADRNVQLTLHWDGKIMRNTTNDGSEPVLLDRLTVVVTGDGVHKILAIPKLPTGQSL